MAVVIKYSRAVKDPAAVNLAAAAQAEGRVRLIAGGPVAVANGDNATSKHYLGRIPSSGIPDPTSAMYVSAITGLNAYHVGLELNGTLVSVAIFASALDLTTAGAKSPFAAIANPDIGKRVYELLGLTSDPAVEYDIIGTMNAAATAAGTINPMLKYSKK